MLGFVIRRFIQSVVVLFIMSLIVFSMINLVGDPVDMLVNPESLPDEIDRVRKDFGLDQPVHIQYWKFLTGALSGDLGNSFIFGRPALSLIAERFPATVELATCALFIAVIIGLPLGIYAGLNPNGLGARVIMGGSVLGISIPTFWLGLMMIIVFSVLLGSCEICEICCFRLQSSAVEKNRFCKACSTTLITSGDSTSHVSAMC